MAEQIVYTSKAVVYYFDPPKKSWSPSNVAQFSRLDIYKNGTTGGYRVIGRGADDTSVISINSMLSKDTQYTRTRETFHQFQDPRYLYGLNFGSAADADAFGSQFEVAVNALRGGGSPAGAAKPPAPVAAKPPAPAAPIAPTAPAAKPAPPAPTGGPPPAPSKPPPPPPKAPAKPTPRPDGDAPERNALLDSITGFSANRLKKTETVDKSGPLIAAPKPAAGESSDAGGGAPKAAKSPSVGGGGGGGDMMAQMLAKRAAMKEKQASAGSVQAAPAPQPAAAEPKKPAAKGNTLTRAEGNSLKASAPVTAPRAKPAASEVFSSTSASTSSGSLPEDLKNLKDEIMTEVRAELAQLKQDILNAISANQPY